MKAEMGATHERRPTRKIQVSPRLFLTVLVLASILLTAWQWKQANSPFIKEHGMEKGPTCIYKSPKKNVWADLDENEFNDVLKYLYSVPNDLNLTRTDAAGPISHPLSVQSWDNHIAIIETLVPNKTDALAYLDTTNSSPPPRYARIIINRGAAEQAGIDEYMVGPLPTSNDTVISSLSWMYNAKRNYVNNPLPNYEDIIRWFADLDDEISDMLQDLLGDAAGHVANAPPLMALGRPAAFENGTVSYWARVHSPGLRMDAWSLLAQGMFCRFVITGRDSSQWAIDKWYYDGILYNSTESLRLAWKSGKLKKMPANKDGPWADSVLESQGHPDRDHVAPVMVQPGGPRHKIDEKERHVTWLGWNFYINAMQAIGVSLWDIRFGGERIMYELGLQEAMAHYTGNDPLSVGMVWLDTLFGMGINSYELIPGYDCPAYAKYLPMTFHQGEKTVYRNNSICVFEWTGSDPIQRHTTPNRVTVSRNNYLVVRHVATVGNYDYTISYFFYLDGALEIKVQASGYIFGAYNSLEAMRRDFEKRTGHAQYDYGYQIHDLVASSMHDHGINFKADLDIAGTANTLQRVNVEPYHHAYPWETLQRSTMRLRTEQITHETGLDWPANGGALFVMVNNETTNRWGEKRGYRIAPGTGMGTPPHLTIQHSPALGKAAGWAYHDLWVLQHHDSERRSASEYNAMEPEEPLVDFAKMADGEPTLQQDLVVYFNLGTHHVPQSGDVPNTLMHWSGSSVMFLPFNFHDRDPSRATAQGVLLSTREREQGGGSAVRYFGGTYLDAVEVTKDMLEPDLTAYQAPDKGLRDLSWNSTLAAL